MYSGVPGPLWEWGSSCVSHFHSSGGEEAGEGILGLGSAFLGLGRASGWGAGLGSKPWSQGRGEQQISRSIQTVLALSQARGNLLLPHGMQQQPRSWCWIQRRLHQPACSSVSQNCIFNTTNHFQINYTIKRDLKKLSQHYSDLSYKQILINPIQLGWLVPRYLKDKTCFPLASELCLKTIIKSKLLMCLMHWSP